MSANSLSNSRRNSALLPSWDVVAAVVAGVAVVDCPKPIVKSVVVVVVGGGGGRRRGGGCLGCLFLLTRGPVYLPFT